MNRKLYKSGTDRVFFGVCGGLAEYFDVDAVIIRLLMAVFAFTGGLGLIFYILAAVIMRESPGSSRGYSEASAHGSPGGENSCGAENYGAENPGEFSGEAPGAPEHGAHPRRNRGSGAVIVGLILIIIGVFYLINQFLPIFYWISPKVLFAAILVILGIYFVARR
ncbi:MAG: PspC domain-containing protein [Clostridiales Family XIII bacterium]|jgi:phage shock protein PspC (stress-responsive transcriptional regulator)/uncharacterized integral membrane protein|nr:PspC domain-containing protein [Clostridiales Family XIII bacterium]